MWFVYVLKFAKPWCQPELLRGAMVTSSTPRHQTLAVAQQPPKQASEMNLMEKLGSQTLDQDLQPLWYRDAF